MYGTFTSSGAPFQASSTMNPIVFSVIRNPGIATGLGSSHFARRYFGNRCFFLFLALLRCFSSGGSPPYVMCWRMDDKGLPCRVSPFGHPRIFGYLRLPAAFRSLSRPSSAPDAKAFPLRSFSLDLLQELSGFSKILPTASFEISVRFSPLPRFFAFVFHFCCLVLAFFVFVSLFGFQGTLSSAAGRSQRSNSSLDRSGLPPSFLWWAQVDSNHRPRAYQARALTG